MKSFIYRLSMVLAVLALSACGGGGGGGGGGGNPPPASVTVSGRITFDRVPFSTTPGGGLDYARTVEAPARRVTVEALGSSGAVIATAATDDGGNYSLQVPSRTSVRIRAKAQSVVGSTGAPGSWSVSVRDNTNGNALYVLDGSLSSSGTAAQTRNLRAASGWGGASYTSARAAAPFAVLDTVYAAIRFIVQQGGYAGAFPALDVFWSTRNTASSDFAPASGHIPTTGYLAFRDGVGDGIYVLGDASLGVASDTDEYDQHVLAHEFQHYVEHRLSRADSWGGDHSLSDRLDLRLAFSEGFADAFSGMVLGEPLYRDSYGARQGQDAHFDMESSAAGVAGWFNETSVSSIAWDLFDTTADGGDAGSVGFGPMFDVFRNELRTDVPLGSIFAFASALKQRPAVDDALVDAVVSREDIRVSSPAPTPYAEGETNDGGLPDALPVYAPLAINGPPVQVCGTRDAGTGDKLGNRRLLRFNVPAAGPVHIMVTAYDAASPADPQVPDPDLFIWKSGLFDYSECAGPGSGAGCTLPLNSEAYDNTAMPQGDYVLEVFEYSHVNPDPNADHRGRTCMLVSITG